MKLDAVLTDRAVGVVLGSAAGAAGLWGMTAHLELDYRGPLPLQTPLVLRARVESHEGRKAFITGTIARASAPEKVLVEARGLFVMPRPEKQAEYFGAITDASGRHAPPRRPGDATALRLAERTLADPRLTEGADTTWNLLLCLDPDGSRRNEGWLAGPYTLDHYFRNFFRPGFLEQPEWLPDGADAAARQAPRS